MSKHPPAAAEPAHPPAPAAAAAPAHEHHAGEKPSFHGKYKYTSNENYPDYLEYTGVSWLDRKLALNMPHELSIVEDGNKFLIKQDGREISFSVGEEFELKQNGHTMKVSPVWEGEKLILTLEPKEEGKGKAEKHTRELKEDELTLTLESGEKKATRVFKKIPEAK